MSEFVLKAVLFGAVVVGFGYWTSHRSHEVRDDVKISMKQLGPESNLGDTRAEMTVRHGERNNLHFLGWCGVAVAGVVIFWREIMELLKGVRQWGAICLLVLPLTGCWRPFEPIKLVVIESTEEAFLLPFTENVEKQTASHTEEFLRKSLVYTQQVKIPQQWVQKGYETFGANGEWRDAAILIKVDKSPETREWTADPNSGTSKKNEAIWVMTADQVEFSTGWTCTARINSREDAVKFLHNYPNGSLDKVMDSEVRAKLSTAFGLEVTDLPMDELRKKATPHITTVVKDVTAFFKDRGIEITNLGITGGFVYKNPSISEKLVEVFNAEQKKNIAAAETAAQSEKNKQIQLAADSKAKAVLTERKGEADGIKMVADAKNYEIEKAKADLQTYLALKALELEKVKLEKWDGQFPTYFMGGGSAAGLNLLLPAPSLPQVEKKQEELKPVPVEKKN
jgi:regulator of protease activity HflC (stomatin/prohibitin superfamily)